MELGIAVDEERPGELEASLNEETSQTQKELIKKIFFGVFQPAIFNRLKEMGMIQKVKNLVPYELKPRDVERCFFTCEQLLQRQKRKGSLHQIVTGDEKWVINKPFLNVSSGKLYDCTELKSAVVVTLVDTRISACSAGLLGSKGCFTGLCIRFADDFETSLDDWKPSEDIMNLCVVSEGTYEICSRTIVPHGSALVEWWVSTGKERAHLVGIENRPCERESDETGGGNAKWILNVQWQMEGVDINVDTNIGKQLSALFKTLTALTGEEDESLEREATSVPTTTQVNHTLETLGRADCYRVRPQVADRGTTFRYEGQLRNKQNNSDK
ncbi:KIAA1109 [Cordylochernes scorpioides]|uniref:KIAA1109 n=1 Tax=Cordylochernes scorpioides TaxID=51811 RepID=A0ABY6L523_9ARAC|nr:KIAA1109 [Cordylochernes scorpioides]